MGKIASATIKFAGRGFPNRRINAPPEIMIWSVKLRDDNGRSGTSSAYKSSSSVPLLAKSAIYCLGVTE